MALPVKATGILLSADAPALDNHLWPSYTDVRRQVGGLVRELRRLAEGVIRMKRLIWGEYVRLALSYAVFNSNDDGS